MEKWKRKIQTLKQDLYAIYLACKDPRVPRIVQILALMLVAYAFSPIDLIPDFIPVLGYLDDLLLIPLGIALLIRMIPPAVMRDCREAAAASLNRERPVSRWGAALIVACWILILAGLTAALYGTFRG